MKKYLITSQEYYSDAPSFFRAKLNEVFKNHNPNFALYRDKENPNYKKLAKDFIEVCNHFKNIKPFLHQDYNLAKKLNAHGVHLTSNQFSCIKNAKNVDLEVIISTHTLDEVKKAKSLGADYVTFSPIFYSPNKGEPKGLDELKKAIEIGIKVFALGGIITEDEVKKLEEVKPYGFASIRYFYQ